MPAAEPREAWRRLHRLSSLASLVGTLVTVVAIALGVLVGAGFRRRTHLEVAPAGEE
ncbi:hypothetical protein ACFYNO_28405 [Kitasatospora sp. NPDC006697]|uniref:hypothetical protein n=1 Tax=Kitasatospora sp. NPDC006697 TaxID=3364020 RepID=UPI0036AFE6EB